MTVDDYFVKTCVRHKLHALFEGGMVINGKLDKSARG
jgi:hypothetical protein